MHQYFLEETAVLILDDDFIEDPYFGVHRYMETDVLLELKCAFMRHIFVAKLRRAAAIPCQEKGGVNPARPAIKHHNAFGKACHKVVPVPCSSCTTIHYSV